MLMILTDERMEHHSDEYLCCGIQSPKGELKNEDGLFFFFNDDDDENGDSLIKDQSKVSNSGQYESISIMYFRTINLTK